VTERRVDPTPEPGGLSGLRARWRAVVASLAFRYAAYAAMTALAVWAERRPAPTLPDAVLDAVPYVRWVADANYLLWLGLYLPVAAGLLWATPARFVRYMVTGGLVSIARGLTLAMTGLGAPDPAVAGPGLGARSSLDAFLQLVSPWHVFAKGTMQAYLTKDLFFSGHTATTLLLLLYAWERPRLRWLALAGHVLVVASVFLAHLHYAIDVVGAYAVTFSLFVLREGWRAPAGASGPRA
jgi:hypothetical protein